jgi:hypothetical protein
VARAIDDYTDRGYQTVWDAYRSGADAVRARELDSTFDRAWQQPFVEELPVGSVLFEGQGRHEEDILSMVFKQDFRWS